VRTPGPLSDVTLRKAIRRAHERNAAAFGGDGKRIDAGTAARVLEVLDAHDARIAQEHRQRRTA
jgi:hypothetical protein